MKKGKLQISLVTIFIIRPFTLIGVAAIATSSVPSTSSRNWCGRLSAQTVSCKSLPPIPIFFSLSESVLEFRIRTGPWSGRARTRQSGHHIRPSWPSIRQNGGIDNTYLCHGLFL
jgi:hypothetical protein